VFPVVSTICYVIVLDSLDALIRGVKYSPLYNSESGAVSQVKEQGPGVAPTPHTGKVPKLKKE